MPIDELSQQDELVEESLREIDPMAGLHGTDVRCGTYCSDYSDEKE
jgi:hypothetical protein